MNRLLVLALVALAAAAGFVVGSRDEVLNHRGCICFEED